MTISQPTKRSFRDLLWALAGGASTGLGLFAYNAVAARALGIEEFGAFAIAIIAMFLTSLMCMFGLDLTIARRVAQAPFGTSVGDAAFVTIGAFAVVLSGVGGAMVVLSAPSLAPFLELSTMAVRLLGLTGALVGIRGILERAAAGSSLYRPQTVIKTLESVVIVAGSLLVWLTMESTVTRFLIVLLVWSVFGVTAYAALLIPRVKRPSVRWSEALHAVGFARHAFVSGMVAFFLMYADKVFLRSMVPARDFALYVAYHAGTVMVAAQFGFVAQNLFLPAGSRAQSSRDLARRAIRILVPAFVPGVGVAAGVLWLVLFAYGADFTFDWSMALIFCAWATLFLCNVIIASLVVSEGADLMRLEARFAILRSIGICGAFVVMLALTDQVSTASVAFVMIGAECAESVNLRRLLRRVA